MEPKQYIIDGLPCYDNAELVQTHPEIYIQLRTKSAPRNIIEKAKLTPNDYRYAHESKGQWVNGTPLNKRAHLFLSKTWVDANFYSKLPLPPDQIKSDTCKSDTYKPGLNSQTDNTKSDTCKPGLNLQTDNTKSDTCNPVPSSVPSSVPLTVSVNPALVCCDMAPPLLELEESEKFRDADGNICEIETRGAFRDKDVIVFNAMDVGKCFGLHNLSHDVLNKEKGFVRQTHYKTFIINRLLTGGSVPNKQKLSLFLTYSGLIRVLMVSRNKHVQRFQHWAETSLFTMQMGSKQQRLELGATVTNTSIRNFIAMFNASATSVSVVYLLLLGTVRDLRDTFRIPETYDDLLKVYKFGFTDNFSERLSQLQTQYGKLKNVSLVPIVFNYIDPKFTNEAEGDVRSFSKLFNKSLDTGALDTGCKYRELIVLNDNELKQMKTQYSLIGNKYAGATTELQRVVRELKDRILDHENKEIVAALKHQIELSDKDKTIMEKQTQVNELTVAYQHAVRQAALEREICELKLQLATSTSTH